MSYNFNTLLKTLIELRYEPNNKNVSVVKKFEAERERFQSDINADRMLKLDQVIKTFNLKKSELITDGNKLYLLDISSPNISQWQKNILPTPVKAAFISHAVAESLRDITETELLEMINKFNQTLNLNAMHLNVPKSDDERYQFFFKLLALAYQDELIFLSAEEIEEKHLKSEAHLKSTVEEPLTNPVKSAYNLKALLSIKYLRWMAALFLILVIGGIGINMTLNPYIDFNDPTLEAVLKREVEGAIGKKIEGKITKEEALSITSITYDLKNKTTTQWNGHEPIKDLMGIQYFKNLVIINFRGNQITEIGALEHLGKLEQLYLGSNQFSNIEPLSGLTGLKRVAIDGNPKVEFLEPLRNLKALELLNISDTNVKDISPILDLKGLKYLYLQGPTEADLSSIQKMTRIEDLYLDNTKLEGDYNFLSQMSNLKHLNLSQNNLNEIEFVTSLPYLEGLDIRENQISDIKPIIENEAQKEVALSAMKYLKMDHNKIQNITGLSTLKELKRLTIAENPIASYNEVYMIWAKNPSIEKDFEIDLENQGSIIQNPHDEVWYEFIPSQTDFYVFFTVSDGNMQGAVFNENREKLLSGWYNEGDSVRFYTEGILEAGNTYYIKIRARGEQLTPYNFYAVGTRETVSKELMTIVGVENHFTSK